MSLTYTLRSPPVYSLFPTCRHESTYDTNEAIFFLKSIVTMNNTINIEMSTVSYGHTVIRLPVDYEVSELAKESYL